jgi:hypothetical protein
LVRQLHESHPFVPPPVIIVSPVVIVTIVFLLFIAVVPLQQHVQYCGYPLDWLKELAHIRCEQHNAEEKQEQE